MADKIATREAYGKALAEFGAEYENLVVLDADLAAAFMDPVAGCQNGRGDQTGVEDFRRTNGIFIQICRCQFSEIAGLADKLLALNSALGHAKAEIALSALINKHF